MTALVLLACLSSRAPEAPAPAAAVATPTIEAPAADVHTVLLDPDELSNDEAAGTVTASPDSRRQTDAYTRYVLDLASLEAALGGRPTGPVHVRVEVTASRVERPARYRPRSSAGRFATSSVERRAAGAPCRPPERNRGGSDPKKAHPGRAATGMASQVERPVPEDPMMPQPEGGFLYTTHTGRVVSRAD